MPSRGVLGRKGSFCSRHSVSSTGLAKNTRPKTIRGEDSVLSLPSTPASPKKRTAILAEIVPRQCSACFKRSGLLWISRPGDFLSNRDVDLPAPATDHFGTTL